jgi:hypothetical protein
VARGEVTPGGGRPAAIRAIIDELVRQRDLLDTAHEPDLVAANRAAIAYWRRRLEVAPANRRDP